MARGGTSPARTGFLSLLMFLALLDGCCCEMGIRGRALAQPITSIRRAAGAPTAKATAQPKRPAPSKATAKRTAKPAGTKALVKTQQRPQPKIKPVIAPQIKKTVNSVLPLNKPARAPIVPIGIEYNGGPVMWKPVSVYIYWLGNFNEDQKSVTRNFIESLNTDNDPNNTVQDWWRLNGKYYDAEGRATSTSIAIKGEYSAASSALLKFDPQRNVQNLTGSSQVFGVIRPLLDAGTWPSDPDAIYVLLTDPTILQVGMPGLEGQMMCRNYCGWHSFAFYKSQQTLAAMELKYIWVGIAGKQLPTCDLACLPRILTVGRKEAPSADKGMSGALSVLAHDLAETTTDPNFKAWIIKSSGEENTDLCAWKFGNILYAPNPSGLPVAYNLVGKGGVKYLIQANLDISTGNCTLN